eukprot:1268616-Rhodomonas_salina.2
MHMLLRISYAYGPMHSGVWYYASTMRMVLRIPYAMSGSEITNVLHMRYAMSGSESAMSLRARYALSGTEIEAASVSYTHLTLPTICSV